MNARRFAARAGITPRAARKVMNALMGSRNDPLWIRHCCVPHFLRDAPIHQLPHGSPGTRERFAQSREAKAQSIRLTSRDLMRSLRP